MIQLNFKTMLCASIFGTFWGFFAEIFFRGNPWKVCANVDYKVALLQAIIWVFWMRKGSRHFADWIDSISYYFQLLTAKHTVNAVLITAFCCILYALVLEWALKYSKILTVIHLYSIWHLILLKRWISRGIFEIKRALEILDSEKVWHKPLAFTLGRVKVSTFEYLSNMIPFPSGIRKCHRNVCLEFLFRFCNFHFDNFWHLFANLLTFSHLNFRK